jgi:hypothetical protein
MAGDGLLLANGFATGLKEYPLNSPVRANGTMPVHEPENAR